MHEQWRPVVGHEGSYEVSNQGNVKSIPRKLLRKDGVITSVAGRIIKPWTKDSGHQIVSLGKGKKIAVHTLVLSAFLGAKPKGMEALHNDGNPANNILSNLRWGTHTENMYDRTRHGTQNRGERHGMSKLTTPETIAIRESSEPHQILADRYKISRRTVRDLKNRTSWKWLE